MSALPIVLRGERVPALVVGGGAVATRKVRAFLEADVPVTVVAPSLSDELRAASATGVPLRLEQRAFDPRDLAGRRLVVAATDRREVNAAVAAEADAHGVLCNVADDPDGSSFWTPAVHRTAGLVIAVSAGGVPTAAARVRDAIAERIDGRYGEAVRLLGALRQRLLADGARERWRAAVDELVGDDFVASVEDGTFAERVQRWA